MRLRPNSSDPRGVGTKRCDRAHSGVDRRPALALFYAWIL